MTFVAARRINHLSSYQRDQEQGNRPIYQLGVDDIKLYINHLPFTNSTVNNNDSIGKAADSNHLRSSGSDGFNG